MIHKKKCFVKVHQNLISFPQSYKFLFLYVKNDADLFDQFCAVVFFS